MEAALPAGQGAPAALAAAPAAVAARAAGRTAVGRPAVGRRVDLAGPELAVLAAAQRLASAAPLPQPVGVRAVAATLKAAQAPRHQRRRRPAAAAAAAAGPAVGAAPGCRQAQWQARCGGPRASVAPRALRCCHGCPNARGLGRRQR